MKSRIISFAITLLAVGSVSAQTVLTLQDCRRLAVENNAKVRIARGNREAAQELSKDAFTKYFPNVSANFMAYKSNKGALQYSLPSLGSLLPAEIAPIIPSQLAPLADKSLGNIELIKSGWNFSFLAMQPVFMGGRIFNGNKLAHVGEEVARLQEENATDEVMVTAEKYYWQIVTLQSKKRTLQSVMQMVDTLEYQVNAAVKAGVVLPNDLLKVQIKRNDLRATMVDLDNGITLASNLLAQYVGLTGDSISIVSDEAPEIVPEYPLSLYIEPQQAVGLTNDYLLLNQNVKATELRTKMAIGENLPEVGLGGGWVYDDLFSQHHNFAAVMLTVNVPITDWWGGSHKIKKSRIEEANARLQQEDLTQLLQIKMENAWDELTASHRKMTIAHESIAQATENLRLNDNYYRVGVSTITDLLDAQTLFRHSCDQYTEAYGDFRLKEAQYLDATGRLGSSTTNP